MRFDNLEEAEINTRIFQPSPPTQFDAESVLAHSEDADTRRTLEPTVPSRVHRDSITAGDREKMSAETYPLDQPNSSDMERDARSMHEDGESDPGKIALGVIIGRSSEFFDFFVYAIASVLVFPHHFFPMYDQLTGLLLSFAVFSLAFLARPVGTVVFAVIDRLYGRGTKLIIALFILGGSTASMSFLPGYVEIGYWSVLLLIIFRLGQGFAFGPAMTAPEFGKYLAAQQTR